MHENRPIRNLSDLRKETAEVRRKIARREQELSEDAKRMVDSVTPARILASVTSKLIASAPAIYTAWSLIRGLLRKRTDAT